MRELVKAHGQKTWALVVSGLSVWGLQLSEAQTGWLLAAGVVVVAVVQQLVKRKPHPTAILSLFLLAGCASAGVWKDPQKADCGISYTQCSVNEALCALRAETDIEKQMACASTAAVCLAKVRARCPDTDAAAESVGLTSPQ